MLDFLTESVSGWLGESVGPRGKNASEDVKRVEGALDTLGYFDTKKTDGPTGYYGERLKQGIQKLQKDTGLKVDGVLNPGGPTEHAILAQPGSITPASTPKPKPKPKPAPTVNTIMPKTREQREMTGEFDPLDILDSNVVRRAKVLPFGEDKRTGDLVFAMPQIGVDVLDAISVPGRVLGGKPVSERDVTNLALTMGGGGALLRGGSAVRTGLLRKTPKEPNKKPGEGAQPAASETPPGQASGFDRNALRPDGVDDYATIDKAVARTMNRRSRGQMGRGEPERIVLGAIDDTRASEVSRAVRDTLGRDIDMRNAIHVMDDAHILHAVQRHGDDSIPLKATDFRYVPDVVRTGEIVDISLGNRGQYRNAPSITYRKRIGDEWLYVVEAVSRGNRQNALAPIFHFQTAYKNPAKK